MKNKKILIAGAAVVLLVLILALAIPSVLKSNRYKQGLSYFNHGLYSEAIERFSGLERYKDSSAYLDYCLLQQAVQAQNWEKIPAIADRIPDFLDTSSYRILGEGYELYKGGKLKDALEKVREVSDLSAGKTLAEKIENAYTDSVKKAAEKAWEEGRYADALAAAEEGLALVEDEDLQELRGISLERVRSDLYYDAMDAIHRQEFEEAEKLFTELGDYQDSAEILKHLQAGEKGQMYLDTMYNFRGTSREMAERYREIGDYADAPEKAESYEQQVKEADYNQAMSYMNYGDWEEAAALLKPLSGYEDSDLQLRICEDAVLAEAYEEAVRLQEWEETEEALEKFEALGDYKDSYLRAQDCRQLLRERDYEAALAALEEGDEETAAGLFASLGDYRDSSIYLAWIEGGEGE